MDEMYQMSQSLHIYSVIALILILVIMISLHKFGDDFKRLTKQIQVLMIFHITFSAAVVLTGSIMMAAKHLSLSPANLLMILSVFAIASLEIKRNRALSKVVKFQLMPKMRYIHLGLKYQLSELVIIIGVSVFSRMASAVSF